MWQQFAEKTSFLWINANPMFGAEIFRKYVRKSVMFLRILKSKGVGLNP